jgi:uncharacterized membrane protein YfcA
MFLSPALLLIVFIVGVLIGGVGIGGVLLVPALKYLGGISLHNAIPACMLSYVVTGAVGAFIYARHGSINWSLAIKVCVGALPGAYLGAFLLPNINAATLEVAIAILLLVSGINALKNKVAGNEVDYPRGGVLLVIGFITGMGSALTGTGGPLVLIPILVWLKMPVLTAIGLSQAIQIPVSLMATVGNFMHGEVDLQLSLYLAVAIAGGAVIGAKTVHMMPIGIIKKAVAGLMVIVGLVMLAKLSGLLS